MEIAQLKSKLANMKGIEAYAAAQAQTVRDYNHEGVELPEIIEDETGPERAHRYRSAIEFVQTLDEEEWGDFQITYGLFLGDTNRPKYKGKWQAKLERELRKKKRKGLIRQLKRVNIVLDKASKKNNKIVEW